MSQLQIGYFISHLDYKPTRYHARLPDAERTLCGRPTTLGPLAIAQGAVFGWTRAETSVERALKALTNRYRHGCKTCIKIAPKHDDAVSRLGRLIKL